MEKSEVDRIKRGQARGVHMPGEFKCEQCGKMESEEAMMRVPARKFGWGGRRWLSVCGLCFGKVDR